MCTADVVSVVETADVGGGDGSEGAVARDCGTRAGVARVPPSAKESEAASEAESEEVIQAGRTGALAEEMREGAVDDVAIREGAVDDVAEAEAEARGVEKRTVAKESDRGGPAEDAEDEAGEADEADVGAASEVEVTAAAVEDTAEDTIEAAVEATAVEATAGEGAVTDARCDGCDDASTEAAATFAFA